MTTEPIVIPIAPDNGMEDTPVGPMSTEWLDEVFNLCMQNPKFLDATGEPGYGQQFTAAEFALLAQMQSVSAQEAAERLCGEGEE
jgi:hypothetical protein